MLSTSPLPSLAISFRRADVTAFWILTVAMLSLMLGLTAVAFGAPMPWTWATGGLVMVLPGLVWPQWFEIGVRAWNKGARLSAAVLHTYVLKVSYYLLFGALSRTGSSLDIAARPREVSRWIPRNRGRQTSADERRGHGLLTYARRPGKTWTVCLLPVVLLLNVLRDEGQDNAPPPGTYTLY